MRVFHRGWRWKGLEIVGAAGGDITVGLITAGGGAGEGARDQLVLAPHLLLYAPSTKYGFTVCVLELSLFSVSSSPLNFNKNLLVGLT